MHTTPLTEPHKRMLISSEASGDPVHQTALRVLKTRRPVEVDHECEYERIPQPDREASSLQTSTHEKCVWSDFGGDHTSTSWRQHLLPTCLTRRISLYLRRCVALGDGHKTSSVKPLLVGAPTLGNSRCRSKRDRVILLSVPCLFLARRLIRSTVLRCWTHCQ